MTDSSSPTKSNHKVTFKEIARRTSATGRGNDFFFKKKFQSKLAVDSAVKLKT